LDIGYPDIDIDEHDCFVEELRTWKSYVLRNQPPVKTPRSRLKMNVILATV
jgi:hypothetical protein